MSRFESVAIIGVGLVGGSLARDLAANGARVLAYDSDPASLDAATREGVVHVALDASLAGVRDAELIVVSVPVDAAVATLQRLAPLATKARLITDVGSTKAEIVSAAAKLSVARNFVGSHPMAGDHRSGFDASRAGLFRDANVYLCPTEAATDVARDDAVDLWRSVGARPATLAADEHDRRVAHTSHVPHILSSALGRLLARDDLPRRELGPGGRDVTRLAGASADLWTAIVRDNAAHIEPALQAIEGDLAALRAALTRGDREAIREWLSASRAWFDAG